MRLITIILAIPLLAASAPVLAERPPAVPSVPAAEGSADTTGGGVGPRERVTFRLFPPRLSAGDWVYLPKLYYSDETSLGIGGEMLLPFPVPGTDPHGAYLQLNGRFTFEEQGVARLVGRARLGGGRYSSKVSLAYSTLPIRFYGVGPDTPLRDEEIYQPQDLHGYIELFRRVAGPLELGVRYEYERLELLEVERDGILDQRTLRGTGAGSISGAGVLFDYDTRDRRYQPTRGVHHEGFLLFFEKGLGGDHEFTNHFIDLRRYQPLGGSTVLATEFFWYAARGRTPFWRLAALGGRSHSRGYRKGRYLDDVLVAAQGELRFPILGRLGAVAFAGLADVAPRPSALRLEHLRSTIGAGLRFDVIPSKALPARLDVAVGHRFDRPRVYLSLDDAF